MSGEQTTVPVCPPGAETVTVAVLRVVRVVGVVYVFWIELVVPVEPERPSEPVQLKVEPEGAPVTVHVAELSMMMGFGDGVHDIGGRPTLIVRGFVTLPAVFSQDSVSV